VANALAVVSVSFISQSQESLLQIQ
jgi:hypothetical protein